MSEICAYVYAYGSKSNLFAGAGAGAGGHETGQTNGVLVSFLACFGKEDRVLILVASLRGQYVYEYTRVD